LLLNAKVVFLLVGLLVGGVVGYITRPESAEIKIGGASIEFSDNKISAGSSDNLTSGQSRHIFVYAAIGGIIGLLVGFAVGQRR
jgi:hypothetical protein